MTRWLRWLAASAGIAFLAACGGSDDDHDDEAETRTVVQVAAADAQFSILAEAIEAAGLADTLSGAGPFTVFAPTDEAFGKLLGELGITKEDLLADTALLGQVLRYHVVAGKVAKADVPAGAPITPLAGGYFKVDAVGSDLVVTDGRNRNAKITATDIPASNGVIHVVDTVLLPPDKTVVATAIAADPEFTTLVAAIQAAGLVDTLNGTGPFTVFAPTNAAFEALLTDLGITQDALLADTALLTEVLKYHVVPGLVLKAQVPVGEAIETVQGETFSVDASLAITDQRGNTAAITATDILASNGVIHVIDKVILPTE